MVQAAERALGAKPPHPHPAGDQPFSTFPSLFTPRVHFAKMICFQHNLRVSEDHHHCLNAPDINRITDRTWHPFRQHFCIIAVFSLSGDRNPDSSSLFLFFMELSALLRVSALPAWVPQPETLSVSLVSRWVSAFPTWLFRRPGEQVKHVCIHTGWQIQALQAVVSPGGLGCKGEWGALPGCSQLLPALV